MPFGWGESTVSVAELVGPAFRGVEGMNVGWPDDEVEVVLRQPQKLRTALSKMVSDFRTLWPGSPIVVDIDVSILHRRLDLRVVRAAQRVFETGDVSRDEERVRRARSALDRWIRELAREARRSGGMAARGYDGTYFHLSLPLRSVGEVIGLREDFPRIEEADWDARYRSKLARTSWRSLRSEAYRFSHLATRVAEWAVLEKASRVLVPSVGLCVHPWLFAARSLSVVATDVSRIALDTIEHPERLPRVYGRDAKNRWHISEIAIHGGGHPDAFEPMPDIADEQTAAELRRGVRFLESDWARVPLDDGSIDVIFATNALPRDDGKRRARVLEEWARVVRPGGFVFTVMHNAVGATAGSYFESLGWKRVDALRCDPDRSSAEVRFQEWLSSG